MQLRTIVAGANSRSGKPIPGLLSASESFKAMRGVMGQSGACALTIVVVNYNHARFLPQCLGAIEAQTRAPFEVLVIDDRSTDDSVAVISAFSPRLPQFRLIRHEVNRGVVASMNEGLREARGTHVLFAAADDWIDKRFVEVSVRMLERYPEAGVCSTLTMLANEAGEITGPFRTLRPLRSEGYLNPSRVGELLVEDDRWFNGNTTIVNRSAALEAGGYDPALAAFTDMFLNMNLAMRHGAVFVPEFLATWRRLGDGYSSSMMTNPSAMLDVLTRAEQRIAAGPTKFPPAFMERWSMRWRYSALRGLVNSDTPPDADWLRSLLPPRLSRLAPAIDRLARLPWVGRGLATLVLFLLLRSPDAIPVLRRRLGWIVFQPRLHQSE